MRYCLTMVFGVVIICATAEYSHSMLSGVVYGAVLVITYFVGSGERED